MNVSFVLDSIAEMVRRGADHVAAFCLGIALGLFALGYAVFWWRPRFRRRRDELEAANERLRGEVEQLHSQFEDKQAHLERLQEINQGLSEEIEKRTHECCGLGLHLMALNGRCADQQKEIRTLQSRLEAAKNVDGESWQIPPDGSIPAFRSLTHGRPPVIAVVNLKGGVGKTTLAANLAAVQFHRGRQVLLVDLDYQNSLTYLCLPGLRKADLDRSGRYVNRILRETSPVGELVLQTAERIGETTGYILAAHERLTDVEEQAMAEWIVGGTHDDIRYRLRSALHAEAVQNEYDLIVLDCPPRLSTACVNALACCDYVLVPVILDLMSAEAVPRLLRWLYRFKYEFGVCPNLSVLGLVANKVRAKTGPSAKERMVWDELDRKCLDAWNEPVHRFSATIPHSVKFADAARENAFAALTTELKPIFRDLDTEIRERLPTHESRRSSVVP